MVSQIEVVSHHTMEFMSLPTEIHYNIQSFLDHPSLLNLSATNTYFRALCPEKKIKESLLCFEKCSLETQTLLTRKDLCPCYTCLKGLHFYNHFAKVSQSQDCDLASEHASTRTCATCLITTRPEVILNHGQDSDWIFQSYATPGGGNCKLYQSRYDLYLRYYSYWLACPKCKLVKRYQGSPHGRRRRYDEALLEGDMCAACYQPVWDKENAERREKKNARARERYREKKEEARKRKEAAKDVQPSREVTSRSIATVGMTGLAFLHAQNLPTPMMESTSWSILVPGWDDFTFF